jgi:4-hydroxy-tetrahydrodipicolinate reductase
MTDSEELPGRSRLNYTPKPRNVETYVQQERIRTVHFGIGAIGAEIVRAALNNPSIEIVGAVDPHPAKAGRDLGEAAGIGRPIGVTVQYDAEALLKDVYADVVVHTTGSSLTEVFPQLMTIVSGGRHRLQLQNFPDPPPTCRSAWTAGRKRLVSNLGTGVSPGFVMTSCL